MLARLEPSLFIGAKRLNLRPSAQSYDLDSGLRRNHGVSVSPLEFMQRLAALVPRPRLHLIRFHGALVPNAKLRAAIVPTPPAHTATEHTDECAQARMTWDRLLKRVFDLDLERCECGGKLKIIAAIEEPAVIERILTHLGLAAQPPPRAPARRVDLLQAA